MGGGEVGGVEGAGQGKVAFQCVCVRHLAPSGRA